MNSILFIVLLTVIKLSCSFNSHSFKFNSLLTKKSLITSRQLSNVDTFRQESPQLFIGNLPFTVDEDRLNSLIRERDGTDFVSIKIIKDKETGRSRGFGYVTYKSSADLESAAAALTNLEIEGRTVKVDIAGKPTDRNDRPERNDRAASKFAPRERENSDNKLFIGNLDFNVEENDLLNLCESKLGSGFVQKVDLVYDKETRRLRGFGYLHFKSKEDAESALSALRGSDLLGRELRVDLAQSKSEKEKAKSFSDERAPRSPRSPSGNSEFSLYIGNLSWDVDSKIIEDMINDMVGVGLLTNVRMAIDRDTNKSRGFCHVDFKDAESMELAMSQLTGVELYSRTLKIDRAQPKRSFEGGSGGSGGSFRRPAGGGRDRYSSSESSGSFSSW
eukprot:gene18744-24509_t